MTEGTSIMRIYFGLSGRNNDDPDPSLVAQCAIDNLTCLGGANCELVMAPCLTTAEARAAVADESQEAYPEGWSSIPLWDMFCSSVEAIRKGSDKECRAIWYENDSTNQELVEELHELLKLFKTPSKLKLTGSEPAQIILHFFLHVVLPCEQEACQDYCDDEMSRAKQTQLHSLLQRLWLQYEKASLDKVKGMTRSFSRCCESTLYRYFRKNCALLAPSTHASWHFWMAVKAKKAGSGAENPFAIDWPCDGCFSYGPSSLEHAYNQVHSYRWSSAA